MRQHFSRFSIQFRVSSDLLSNTGESLDHSQSERLHEDEPREHDALDEGRPRVAVDPESNGPVAGPSEAHWGEGNRDYMHTVGTLADPSGTHTVDFSTTSLQSAGSSAGLSGFRGNVGRGPRRLARAQPYE